jgi:hypothetical protein
MYDISKTYLVQLHHVNLSYNLVALFIIYFHLFHVFIEIELHFHILSNLSQICPEEKQF